MRFRFYLLIFFLLLILALIGGAYLRLRHSFLPFLSRVNFVFIDQNYQPLVFSLAGKESLIMTLPATDKVKVSRGFGEYELRKVYALGELEKKGGILLGETVQENVPVAIFGYFYDKNASLNSSLSQPKNFLVQTFWRALWGKAQTDRSRLEILWLLVRAEKLDEDLIEVKNFNGQAGDSFKDRRLREESLSVEVLNATDHFGLAQETAQFLDDAGSRVIRVADALERQEKCRIVVRSDLRQSYTVRWLQKIYPCQLEPPEKEGNRADIALVLGEEYWQRRGEKW